MPCRKEHGALQRVFQIFRALFILSLVSFGPCQPGSRLAAQNNGDPQKRTYWYPGSRTVTELSRDPRDGTFTCTYHLMVLETLRLSRNNNSASGGRYRNLRRPFYDTAGLKFTRESRQPVSHSPCRGGRDLVFLRPRHEVTPSSTVRVY